VVAPRATDAGALATALCVMPAEDGLRLTATLPDVECLLVMNDGRRIASEGWSGLETPRAPGATRGVFAAVAATGGGAPAGGATWDPAVELTLNFELASPGGGRAKRPFLALWIEDKDGFPVRTVALWYHGNRWLPEMRAWSHADHLRAMADGTQIAESISSATRGPGKYSLKWDGRDAGGQLVPAGKYTLCLEVAREHGTHQLIRREVDFSDGAARVDFPANAELASAWLDYRRKGAVR
jgi:FAD:protein FMN transferase